MRLGLTLGYSGRDAKWDFPLIQEADSLGYSVVWSAEAYGSDCVSPLAWAGALTQKIRLGTGIMQIPARSPSMMAMTALTLDHLSNGRFVLGMGMSGPQVVEGWHGTGYGKVLGRTRECVSILRQVFKREGPLMHNGVHYNIPYQGADATGLGKPLKSILRAKRTKMPIHLAAIGPKNTALAAEIGDGWMPSMLAPEHFALCRQWLEEGIQRAGGGKTLDDIEINVMAQVELGDDVQACRDRVKPHVALYVGGMGARGRNYYNDLAKRFGYEDAAIKVQDLYLGGKKEEAAAAIPDGFVDEIALCGPKERIAERLQRWNSIPNCTLCIRAADQKTLRCMAEIAL